MSADIVINSYVFISYVIIGLKACKPAARMGYIRMEFIGYLSGIYRVKATSSGASRRQLPSKKESNLTR